MNKFTNIDKAISWIENQRRFNNEKDFKKLKKAMNLLDLNLSKTKKIHILGTNGKGSTQAFIANALIENNLIVGSFTSPYLTVFNERIKINNININNNELLILINFIYNFNLKYNFNLSFFELMTLMSFKYFSNQNVDVIIMEAGIGGRLDATSIINYDVSVITSIGYDHVKILGNDLGDIAYEKVSALKDNSHLITYSNKLFNDIYLSKIKKTNSTYKFINKNNLKLINNSFLYNNLKFDLNLKGKHQFENAVLAYETLKYLYKLSDDNIVKHLNEAIWPGRFEKIFNNTYIDGAHNEDAIKALIKTINSEFENKTINIVFSALMDKDISSMIKLIEKENYNIILTSFNDPRFKSLKNYENDNVCYNENLNEVIKHSFNNRKEDEVTIFTGSLHFIGYIKKVLKDENYISHS